MGSKVVIGTCRLCLKANRELCDSHYVPAAVYRQLREDKAKKPDPWVITPRASVQTSRQLSAHLLCEDCEGMFSSNGEDWVGRHFLKANGSFKLATILAAQTPLAATSDDPTRVYLAANIPEVDPSALAYFAASVFWRGSIYPWNDERTIPVPLGKYGEDFRKYLLGESPFPTHAALIVSVRQGGDVSMTTMLPYAGKVDGARGYNFLMPGLAFVLGVGRDISPRMKKYCFVRGVGNPIASTPAVEPHVEEIARRMHIANKRSR